MSKYLSRADLERIGSTVVTQFYQAIPCAKFLPMTVDPVILAQEFLGLQVSYLPLSADGSVLGLACFQKTVLEIRDANEKSYQVELSGRDIVLDSSLKDAEKVGRRNFTAAHELAHHILVRLYPEDYRHLLRCRVQVLYRNTGKVKNWEEWQADAMGAAILMPEQTVRGCMEMFGLGTKLDLLSSVCRPIAYKAFCMMAAYMGVSKKALAIRMKQLGLLDEEYLEHPSAPLDIWKDE